MLRQAMVVRYRTDGHIRFQLPAHLCTPEIAAVFEEELLGVDGVYRVLVYRRAGKLSVRYRSEFCGLAAVAEGLQAATERIAAGDFVASGAPEEAKGPFAFVTNPARRLKAQYMDMRNKAEAVYDLVAARNKLMAKVPFDPEGWTVAFANDLVVFYLVKVHWDRITKQWLPHPIRHRYEWMAVMYLTFLLVRYRRAQNAAKAQLTHQPKPK